MLRHIHRALPEEACGFLAGNGSDVNAVIPVTNQLHSAVRFQMEPMEQYRAMQWIDQNDLEILAIFHSHPSGPPVPSATDLAEHAYPEALCLIWSPAGSRARLRCFRIGRGQFEELSIISGVKN